MSSPGDRGSGEHGGGEAPTGEALVRDYHEQTKHHLDRFAPGPASIDWDAQPSGFRHFAGCERVPLPLGAERLQVSFNDLRSGTTLGPTRPEPALDVNAASIGLLLELSLAISAWKADGLGARWAVRCNPSSGNLHPLEAYALLPAGALGPAGVYHYAAETHELARRCTFDDALSGRLATLLGETSLLLGLALVPWREAWKYGLRAWRYCQLDLGHGLAALAYAAAALGWRLRELDGWSSADLAGLLGLDRAADFEADEPEYPATLIAIGPEPPSPEPGDLPPDRIRAQRWQGKANRLDRRHFYRWDQVDAMARLAKASVSTTAALGGEPMAAPPPRLPPGPDADAVALIQTRRSARAFDPRRALDKDAFLRILDGCRPRIGSPPWDERQPPVPIHHLLFVHRVAEMPPGLYWLAAAGADPADLRGSMRPEFAWDRPASCPAGLPLLRLATLSARKAAMRLGCHQQLCAQSAFALAMLGELDAVVCRSAAGYDALLREAGRMGQALYLNAAAEGAGASGIGCFFDDPLHELLGLRDQRLQALYMFTVGPALPDLGLLDAPAYDRGGA